MKDLTTVIAMILAFFLILVSLSFAQVRQVACLSLSLLPRTDISAALVLSRSKKPRLAINVGG